MDFNIEISFVKKYVKKEYQERLIFELQSKKHREKAISRFSHFSKRILNNCFEECGLSEINALLIKKDANEKCYIISHDKNDGKMLLLVDAVEYCKNSYMTVILIFDGFVIVKEELERSTLFLVSK